MCGQNGAHETYCLDACSGYEGQLPGEDNFMYRYYMVRMFLTVPGLPTSVITRFGWFTTSNGYVHKLKPCTASWYLRVFHTTALMTNH